MTPQTLDDATAPELAERLLEGFDRHYRLFRQVSSQARRRFERGDWAGQQKAQADRIAFYDERVNETVALLRERLGGRSQDMRLWSQAKLHYIGLLTTHHQPELAETFFNSVTCQILHRSYFNNDFIFVRPAVSTEYLENTEPAAQPTYRVYYPEESRLQATLERIITNFQLERPFEDLSRDVQDVMRALRAHLGMDGGRFRLRTNFQIQVLSSLFYRNKGAYVVGKVVNGYTELGFALPILHNEAGQLVIDTALFGEDDLQMLFSFARAYFMVDMEIPAAFVQFLRSLMPRKPRAELYNALGLQKHGKSLFYRDFLHHLRHSGDRFRIAPGIKGMVMLVFDLPSFPYVFKLIKDFYPPQKETTREQIQQKYLLVKQHDRVGRMADTLEYSNVAFPLHRFESSLLDELRHFCPSLIEVEGDQLVVKHLYIERRMIPLNLYLQEASPEQLERGVLEYGQAIKDLVAANIFPGDMLWKNFGVTRHGKVVFYDYDEIEYLTDCHFRRVPAPRHEEDEMSGEVWYPVGPLDVFPETFGPFLLGHPGVRDVFMKHHAELLDPAYWLEHQQRIRAGHMVDIFPYDPDRRFASQRAARTAGQDLVPADRPDTASGGRHAHEASPSHPVQ